MAMMSLTAAYFVGTLVANRLAVRIGVNTLIMLGSALLLAGAALFCAQVGHKRRFRHCPKAGLL